MHQRRGENTHPIVNLDAETAFVGRKDDPFQILQQTRTYQSYDRRAGEKGCNVINASGDADVDIVKAAVIQIMLWIGKEGDMNTVDWGWKLVDNWFLPVMTSKTAAPDSLLQIIHCNCTTACHHNGAVAGHMDCHAYLLVDHVSWEL